MTVDHNNNMSYDRFSKPPASLSFYSSFTTYIISVPSGYISAYIYACESQVVEIVTLISVAYKAFLEMVQKIMNRYVYRSFNVCCNYYSQYPSTSNVYPYLDKNSYTHAHSVLFSVSFYMLEIIFNANITISAY